jgi:hypothetical protein
VGDGGAFGFGRAGGFVRGDHDGEVFSISVIDSFFKGLARLSALSSGSVFSILEREILGGWEVWGGRGKATVAGVGGRGLLM